MAEFFNEANEIYAVSVSLRLYLWFTYILMVLAFFKLVVDDYLSIHQVSICF